MSTSAVSTKNGSIPAQAGSPSRLPSRAWRLRVHPRAGGVTRSVTLAIMLRPGPSPRRRGHRNGRGDQLHSIGSIPAQAGSPHGASASCTPARVHPRAGGVTSPRFGDVVEIGGPSPRRRGHRLQPRRSHSQSGSIPAQAGSPGWNAGVGTEFWVHPRAGGVTSTGEVADSVHIVKQRWSSPTRDEDSVKIRKLPRR